MAAIVPGDIVLAYSTKSGSAGNSTASGASTSLGKYMSNTEWTGGLDNDLFDDVTAAENTAAGPVDYRCLFVYNTNPSNTYQGVTVYLAAEVAGGVKCSIAADTTAASVANSSSAQALTATTESAPGGSITGLTFTSPTTAATGIVLGDIPSGSCRAFWVRRVSLNAAAMDPDGVSIGCQGTSGHL